MWNRSLMWVSACCIWIWLKVRRGSGKLLLTVHWKGLRLRLWNRMALCCRLQGILPRTAWCLFPLIQWPSSIPHTEMRTGLTRCNVISRCPFHAAGLNVERLHVCTWRFCIALGDCEGFTTWIHFCNWWRIVCSKKGKGNQVLKCGQLYK